MVTAVPLSITVKKPGFMSTVINVKDKLNWLANILFLR